AASGQGASDRRLRRRHPRCEGERAVMLVSGTDPGACRAVFLELAARGFGFVGPELESAAAGVGRLVDGVHFGTNPDPRTGVYLRPGGWPRSMLRVTPRGLIRSDRAYLDAAIFVVEAPAQWRSRWAAAGRIAGDPDAAWRAQVGAVLSDLRLRGYRAHV